MFQQVLTTLKKRWLATGLAVALAVGLAGTAFAALTPDQTQEIAGLHEQILNLQKQIVQKNVEYGQLTAEQAQKITEHMDAQFKARQEAGFTNCHPFQGKQLGPRPDKNWQG
ncbi:MAG: YckD family protein, partial [Heliobacteriaceae bacterium]|nr:YckD family protein [Heliobacteriaceae bacterium]